MSHVEFWVTHNGILNLECAVFPPDNNRDVNPLEATLRTIWPLEVIDADSVSKWPFNHFLHNYKQRKSHP
jgi:hypothetical protein